MKCPTCGTIAAKPAAQLGAVVHEFECECGAEWRADRWGRLLVILELDLA